MTSRTDHVLRQFFEPRGVVVVGSLREGRGEGWTAIDNMQRLGYKGGIFPVNPGYAQVLGRKAYPSIDAVMEPFDLAVIITPPPTVVGMIEQCARKGVKAIIVSTEGFAESGEAGAVMQRQLLDTARGLGVRIIGPNTLGIVNTANGLVTNPYPLPYNTIHRGGIAFSSQSGIIGAHAQPMEDRVYHVGKMCDFGNKSDIDESDWLEYLTYDPLTSVISIHLETVKDGARLLDSLRKAVARKPVLVLKTGRTEAGARASASHTGSLAQDQRAINELIKQAGALPLGTWQEFWEVPKVFDSQPLPRGNRIAVVTLTGGVGVTATDVAMESGLEMARFSDNTQDTLRRLSPGLGKNPADVGPAMVLSDDPLTVYRKSLTAVAEDPNVDCVAVILFAGSMPPVESTVEMLSTLKQRSNKPLVAWMYGPSVADRERLSRGLETAGVPAYLEMETAIRALGIAATYARFRREISGPCGQPAVP